MEVLFLSYGIYSQLKKPEHGDEQAAFDAAQTLVLIAKVSRTGGGAAQAKSMMGHALRTFRVTLGDTHPQVAAVLNSMSVLCVELANCSAPCERKALMEEARAYAEEALAISEECVTEADLSSAE